VIRTQPCPAVQRTGSKVGTSCPARLVVPIGRRGAARGRTRAGCRRPRGRRGDASSRPRCAGGPPHTRRWACRAVSPARDATRRGARRTRRPRVRTPRAAGTRCARSFSPSAAVDLPGQPVRRGQHLGRLAGLPLGAADQAPQPATQPGGQPLRLRPPGRDRDHARTSVHRVDGTLRVGDDGSRARPPASWHDRYGAGMTALLPATDGLCCTGSPWPGRGPRPLRRRRHRPRGGWPGPPDGARAGPGRASATGSGPSQDLHRGPGAAAPGRGRAGADRPLAAHVPGVAGPPRCSSCWRHAGGLASELPGAWWERVRGHGRGWYAGSF
jgi:hypothetical protein